MEKEKEKNSQVWSENQILQTAPPPRVWLTKSQVAVLGLGLFFLALFAPLPQYRPDSSVDRLIWSNATYTEYRNELGAVDWRPCTGLNDIAGSECGHIIVPKDYFNASAGTAKIALGRLRARANPSKGSVLFNPGGPGGAGKQWVTTRGDLLQVYVRIGDEYDIVGFDPRGIGETEPKTQCFDRYFPYADFKRNSILERSYDFPSNASLEEIRQLVLPQQREAASLLKTTFAVCKETMGDELKYMGTSTVVRDIDYMVKKLDGEDALINFYGGSYGSILGQYLVNMLPNRLGRIVIDGIADAVAWSEKPSYKWYSQWLMSSENNYDQFIDGCAEAGSQCALAREGESSSDLKARLEAFFNDLFYKPLPAPNATFPGVLTVGRARVFMQLTLLTPLGWQNSASALAAAMAGDPTLIVNALGNRMYRDLERSAVSCNDNPRFPPPSAEEVVDELLDVYQNVTRFVFSTVTTEPDAGCEYWPVTPPERFSGPWNHTLNNPILVLSNTEDPVTPLDSALKVQDHLGDSARLLLQDGPGHCTLALPSFCTASAVQAFFSNGTLPEKGTVCKPDIKPFHDLTAEPQWSTAQMQQMIAIPQLHDALLEARSSVFNVNMRNIHKPQVKKSIFKPVVPVALPLAHQVLRNPAGSRTFKSVKPTQVVEFLKPHTLTHSKCFTFANERARRPTLFDKLFGWVFN
ncbi:hypothetical protein EIP91_010701 [Steccherinum ochraceum]|uniref:Uncharacterized protein n=1 Tax=Steccherinum ochraceum TaxID=92696 RepID=A0A4R0R2U8_9APHY|nr:hypothetical protein EIP91_010701 [Steccherinum ochraceum]